MHVYEGMHMSACLHDSVCVCVCVCVCVNVRVCARADAHEKEGELSGHKKNGVDILNT